MAEQRDPLELVAEQRQGLPGQDAPSAAGSCWLAVLPCLLLACSYVGSLYVWRSDLPR